MGISQEKILESKCNILLEQNLELEREKNEREEIIIEFLRSLKPGEKLSDSDMEKIKKKFDVNNQETEFPENLNQDILDETFEQEQEYPDPEDEVWEEPESSYEILPIENGNIIEEYISGKNKLGYLFSKFKFLIVTVILIIIALGVSAAVIYTNHNSIKNTQGYIEKLVTESVSVATEDMTGTILNSENLRTITKQVRANLSDSLTGKGFSEEEIEFISDMVTNKTTEILQNYTDETIKMDAEKEAALSEKITDTIIQNISENLEQFKTAIAILLEKLEKMQIEFSTEIDALQDKITAIKLDLENVKDDTGESYETLEKLSALEEQLKKIKNHISDTSQYDSLKAALDNLDKELLNLIDVIDIESLNAAMNSFAVSISSIDTQILTLDNSMGALEDVFTASLDNVDEELRGEIEGVLSKMDKLSEDVYDKSIVDSHIQNIQNSLNNIYASAGELDADLQQKFSQAQKDLEALKQETESGYYDKNSVNNKITEINKSISEGLSQISDKADSDLKGAIEGVEKDLDDFGRNVEMAYKEAIDSEVKRLQGELEEQVAAANAANAENTSDIDKLKNNNVTVGNSIAKLIEDLGNLNTNVTANKADIQNTINQLTELKTGVQNGYYSKGDIDAALANVQTVLDALSTATGANTQEIVNVKGSLTALNESLNTNIQNVSGRIDNLDTKVNECFQSVSDGKALVAAAITDKGASTAANASYQQMANNINGISTGTKVRYWVLGGNGSVNIANELGDIHTQLNKDDFIVSAEYGGGGFKAGGDGDEWTGWGKCTYEYNPSAGILTATHQDWRQNNEKSVRQQWEQTRGQIYIIYKGRL